MSIKSKMKVPWGLRFFAWWEGYDVADLMARLDPKEPKETAEPEKPEEPEEPWEPEETPRKRKKTPKTTHEMVNQVPWSDIRIRLTQLIWGVGYCGPGGPANIFRMAKFLNLTSEKSVVVLGAGLGGPVRTLVEKYGVWVDGYESSEALANEGMTMSFNLGMTKKARIIHKDLNNIYNISRHYDCFFSKEALFTVKNKSQLLKAIYQSLKPYGLFLFTDFVLREESCLKNPDVKDWIRQEPHKPYPAMEDDFVKVLEKCGFTVRGNDDITKYYLKLVAEAWENAEQLVEDLVAKGDDAKESLETVAREAKFWERRKKIMISGDLFVRRYLVHKKPEIN